MTERTPTAQSPARRLLGMLVLLTLCSANTTRAQTRGEIGFFADPNGQHCQINTQLYVPVDAYILAKLGGQVSAGVMGAEFRITGMPTDGSIVMTPTANPASSVALGNPFSDDSQPIGSQGGANIAFPACQTGPNNYVLLYTVQLVQIAPVEDVLLEVKRRDPPSSWNRAFPILNACDAPVFTPYEANGLTSVINPVSQACGPDRFFVGLYPDSVGTASSIVAPRSTWTRAYLRGSLIPVQGGEFRLEVEDPTGFIFHYNPPQGAQVVGNLFDLDAADSLNVAGVTVQFDSCQGDPSARADFGSVDIYNVNGTITNVTVKQKQPLSNPSYPCPILFQCNPPLFTPACMETEYVTTVLSAGAGTPTNVQVTFQDSSESVLVQWSPQAGSLPDGYNVYRSGIGDSLTLLTPTPLPDTFFVDTPPVGGNLCYEVAGVDLVGQEGGRTSPVCEPIFITENLELDLRLGEPVTTVAPLFQGRSFLVRVSGTVSLWLTDSWNPPNVVCGVPEAEPMFPSPGAFNYWVGSDAEVRFSEPYGTGADCGVVTLPRHETGLQMDSGGGAMYVEPIGGVRTSPAPLHTYTYLLEGADSTLTLSWNIGVPSVNYGVFRISVEEVDAATDVLDQTPRSRNAGRVRAMPNPFNPQTRFEFDLERAGIVVADILDVRGRRLRHLRLGPRRSGPQSFEWDGRAEGGTRVPTGTYYVVVRTAQWEGVTKVTLVK